MKIQDSIFLQIIFVHLGGFRALKVDLFVPGQSCGSSVEIGTYQKPSSMASGGCQLFRYTDRSAVVRKDYDSDTSAEEETEDASKKKSTLC